MELTVPLVFVTKLWGMGRTGLIIKVPKELRSRAESFRQEKVYVLILPESALEHQEVVLKSKSDLFGGK